MADSNDVKDASYAEEGTVQKSTKKTREHRAAVACYVKNRTTGKIYGITNCHVTLHAIGDVQIKTKDQKKTELGKPIKTTHNTEFDVGLIEIKEIIQHRTKNQITNKHHASKDVSLYSGPFESVYEKKVFKCKPMQTCYEVPSYKTPDHGLIAPKLEHLEFYSEENGQFLVKNDSDEVAFSVEGESGTAVALDKADDGNVELIGIICGGFREYTICLFLPQVLDYLRKVHGMDLELCSDEHETSVKQNSEILKRHGVIPCGIAIFIICKTPEQIAPLNFDLLEYAFIMIDYKYGEVNLRNHEELLQKEQKLCVLVNQRGTVHDCSIFENEKPEYVAVERGLLACDSLYEGNVKNAETCLKQAIKCVCKSEDLGLRLFCKLITYITWFCLATNTAESLEQMQLLLQEALECFQEYRDLSGFPKEVMGYLYYDYSRYFLRQYDNVVHDSREQSDSKNFFKGQAVEKAKLSAREFRSNYDQETTPQTLRRVVLSDSNLAYAILGCGHDFNIPPCEISEEDISEAEKILTHVSGDLPKAPLVQNVDYLLAMCDLRFRKGDMKKALETAEQCLAVLKGKQDQVGIHRATCRVKKLIYLMRHD